MNNTVTRRQVFTGPSGYIDCTLNNKPAHKHTLQVFAKNATTLTCSLWGSTRFANELPVYPDDFYPLIQGIDGTQAHAVAFAVDKSARTVVPVCDAIAGSGASVAFGYAGV